MSSRKKAQAAFAAALIFLVLSGIATTFAIVRLRTSQRWVDHTLAVQTALSTVNSVFARTGRERSQYVDSGAPDALEKYQSLLPQILQSVGVVKELTADNPLEQANCVELEKLATERIALMNKAIALKQTGGASLENEAEINREIVVAAGDVDKQTQRMYGEEQALLEKRVASTQRFYSLTGAILIGTFLLAVIFFVIHYRLLNTELLAREQADESLRFLSARLLQFQDEERRKFSRELHDSLGQYLAAAKMNLAMLEPSLKGNPLFQECMGLLDKSLLETRTISHLLHPPLLDEAGLPSAARWYVEGFAKRSGIQTKLDIPDNLRRLPDFIELALFRIMQEGLTNIHRHAKSEKAAIAVARSGNRVTLSVRDYGAGIPGHVLDRFKANGTGVGVGLAGMRERIHQLGGRLEVASNSHGTLITASLPLSDSADSLPQDAPFVPAVPRTSEG
jgi:signal transduction histidine kinase